MKNLPTTPQRDFLIAHGWSYTTEGLTKLFEFKNFKSALLFSNHVGWLAEKRNHHPKIVIDFRRVTLFLLTHDAQNTLTEKDEALAFALEQSLTSN
jgi:4a-hydroxytetrahydrobiopterin dehydratase